MQLRFARFFTLIVLICLDGKTLHNGFFHAIQQPARNPASL